ncbi:2-succinyl-6-hydroxy-2,4-cyclohexadiene-1-carboxylate synthase [Gracilibacillus caseinilyticus]|uniref:Putative 2-succinyl-6-hydroxy-2,4-cyclohexadiene-1-carboxylate synthase n=1 Tax=Gracilibacillus caseinilyticus TaxID=2932256 RepID=A0ABY4EUL2_9BACI|nr:2-succinyl-6-hydroxy-2,4-cyclohexadiene-1-carboxylate synthase [Gracilibacillus caseinilyticus]UOQ48096.1 2-succinyl-6-hydroxy-2,4-cyclohexadiene-1-carboxylate synthase [Gracilibacillus caseinilyticus]
MYICDFWVESFGEGEPVVFFHGFTGSAQTWQFIRDMIPDRKLIFVDLPGHGKTIAKVASMEQCCLQLYELFRQLRIDSFDLVGYSMGGRTALAFVSLYPDLVRSLTLESASPGIADDVERETRMYKDLELASFIRNHLLDDFVDKWENIPLFASQKQLPLSVQQMVRLERLSHTREGLAMSLESMGTGKMASCWQLLKQVGIPVLLLVGEWDKKFIDINQEMMKLLPNSECKLIEQAGHAIHVEQSRIFGTIVKEFINRRRSSNDSRMDK